MYVSVMTAQSTHVIPLRPLHWKQAHRAALPVAFACLRTGQQGMGPARWDQLPARIPLSRRRVGRAVDENPERARADA